jgi:splicing factor 3A subunit 3
LRRKEIDTILSASDPGEFYKRLKVIKEFHRKSPDEPAESIDSGFIQFNKDKEFEGKCVSLKIVLTLHRT